MSQNNTTVKFLEDLLNPKTAEGGGIVLGLLTLLALFKAVQEGRFKCFTSIHNTRIINKLTNSVRGWAGSIRGSNRGSNRSNSDTSDEEKESITSNDSLSEIQDPSAEAPSPPSPVLSDTTYEDDLEVPVAPPVLRRSPRIGGTGMESIFSANDMRMINARVRELLSEDKDAGFKFPGHVQ